MNLDKINNTKKEIIRSFSPAEMEAYIKSLISNLYEAFINLDTDKALASKELIEKQVLYMLMTATVTPSLRN